MRVIVIGRSGQLARALAERASGDLDVVRLGRPDLDLETVRDISDRLCSLHPDIIVNTAAFTDVDGAERTPEAAFRVNCDGARRVAEAAATLGVPLVHLSTEYVFDGGSDRPYRETDPTAPLNVYGRSKLSGEAAVAEITADHAILRTSWLYSPYSRNFFTKVLEKSRGSAEIPVVADRLGSPTTVFELARGIEQVARNLLAWRDSSRGRGMFHMTCAGETSWAGFASEILRNTGCTVRPVTSDSFVELARRPMNSRLCNDRLSDVHGVALARWQDALSEVWTRYGDVGR